MTTDNQIRDKKLQYDINRNYKNNLLLSRKRLDEIEELSKKNDYNSLKYIAISSSEESEFDKSKDPVLFLNDIKKGKI